MVWDVEYEYDEFRSIFLAFAKTRTEINSDTKKPWTCSAEGHNKADVKININNAIKKAEKIIIPAYKNKSSETRPKAPAKETVTI